MTEYFQDEIFIIGESLNIISLRIVCLGMDQILY